MPRKAKAKEVRVSGPDVYVDGDKLVGFETNFSASGLQKLDINALQEKALAVHQTFMNSLSEQIASLGEVPDALANEDVE